MGRCSLLRCVEISSAGKRAFWRSAARLPVPHIPLEYHVASAGSSPAAWLDGVDVAILDPPRKGLDAQLLAFLCTKAPRPPKLELAQSGRQHQMACSNHDKILRATGPDGERDDMTSTDIAGLASMPGEVSLPDVPRQPSRRALRHRKRHESRRQSSGLALKQQAEAAPRSLRQLIYLSCGWTSFVHDCEALSASGNWKLASARAFVFFPGTDSLETLAVFMRSEQ